MTPKCQVCGTTQNFPADRIFPAHARPIKMCTPCFKSTKRRLEDARSTGK